MTSLDGVNNILAIRLSGIGDVILMMPALAELKRAFPNAGLTLITGSQCVTIAQLCPYIDNVVPVDRKALKNKPKLRAAREIYGLIRDVRTEDFDLVVDFHSLRETNLMTWVSGAHWRLGFETVRACIPVVLLQPRSSGAEQRSPHEGHIQSPRPKRTRPRIIR